MDESGQLYSVTNPVHVDPTHRYQYCCYVYESGHRKYYRRSLDSDTWVEISVRTHLIAEQMILSAPRSPDTTARVDR